MGRLALLGVAVAVACDSSPQRDERSNDESAGDAGGDSQAAGDAQPTDDIPDAPADFWMPAIASITNVNRNTATAVDIEGGNAAPGKWYNGFYGANGFGDMTYAWNGAVWAEGYSADGAMVFFGGGHGANIGCYSYLFDVTTRMWKQVGAERNLPPNGDWAGGYPYDASLDARDAAWLDYDYNGGKLIVLGHQYASVAYIAPREGGAPGVGSLLVANGEFDQTAGHAAAWGSWSFSLSDGLMARARSDAPEDGVGSGQLFALKDSVNAKIWYLVHGRSTVRYHDLTEPVPRPLHEVALTVEPSAPNEGYMPVYDVTWLYVPEATAALGFLGAGTANGGVAVVMIDFSSGSPVMAAVTIPSQPGGAAGFAHGGQNIGAAWDSKRKRVVLYEGIGDTFTHVLTPSSTSFRTATWTWSRESYAGRAPANGKGDMGVITSLQAAWGRWRYVPTLDVFVWMDGPSVTQVGEDGVTRDGTVQFWHPTGTPF